MVYAFYVGGLTDCQYLREVRGVPHPLLRRIVDEVSGSHPAIDIIKYIWYFWQ
jgi:hypothetical protein